MEEADAAGHLVVGEGLVQETTDLNHASQGWAAGAVVAMSEDLRAFLHTLLATEFLSPQRQADLTGFVPTMQPGIAPQ